MNKRENLKFDITFTKHSNFFHKNIKNFTFTNVEINISFVHLNTLYILNHFQEYCKDLIKYETLMIIFNAKTAKNTS